MLAALAFTPSESKRLIAKGVAAMPAVQFALSNMSSKTLPHAGKFPLLISFACRSIPDRWNFHTSPRRSYNIYMLEFNILE